MNNFPPQFNQSAFGGNFVASVSQTMKRVYLNMTLALVVTAFVALYCASSIGYLNFILSNSWSMIALCIVELGLVLGISGGINRLSSTTATVLFYLFAVVNGMTLAPIFLVYTGASIAKTFFITAGTFGAMSVYGYCTNRDLTKMGSLLFMGLIGLIIASVVNLFLKSSGLDWIISIAGVALFVGLTAWDTQKIKLMAEQMPESSVWRLGILGALSLYLDFINLFIYLLRIFGSSSRD